MDLSKKTIMVIGLGKSGNDLLDFLDDKAESILAFDSNEKIKEQYINKKYKRVIFYIGENPTGNENVDLVIISPGIPLDVPFIKKFNERNIDVIGEVEFAYNFAKGQFIGITGTNGKTTTTTLVGELFKNANFDTRVVGNIGKPIISEVITSTDNTIFVAELSSFQLETINNLHLKTATIINVTPDHLNRHKTMENYANIKFRIFENQKADDFAVINIDDEISLNLSKRLKSRKIFITTSDYKDGYLPLMYVNENNIVFKTVDKEEIIVSCEILKLKGKHNLENILIALSIAKTFTINNDTIKKTLENFWGVEHRLEFVKKINGVEFINDSKGTNPDASIKAIEAIEKNIILIAGGMDKKSDFDDFAKKCISKVKKVILLGETKDKIMESFSKYGFKNCIKVNDMKEAVFFAYNNSVRGDTVLLSPACASWDMYSCFEERGTHFKNIVDELE